MIFHLHLPDFFAGGCVQHVNIGANVAEVDAIFGALTLESADGNGGSNACIRLVGPIDTARLRVDRIHGTGVDSQKYPATCPGGLAINFFSAGDTESPF